jgi:C4-dicarboxylate-specific signal transduction histidine kinase
LKQLIERAVSICQHDIRKKVKSLQIDIPGNLPPVWSDPDAIELILVNLLINAAHASDKEDSWIDLRVTVDESNPNRRMIAITDNGCGMDEQSMKKIFDPFHADKSPTKGIDLGLYICQSLAENLGCRIEVESRRNQGSCFRVILNDRPRGNRVFLKEHP